MAAFNYQFTLFEIIIIAESVLRTFRVKRIQKCKLLYSFDEGCRQKDKKEPKRWPRSFCYWHMFDFVLSVDINSS